MSLISFYCRQISVQLVCDFILCLWPGWVAAIDSHTTLFLGSEGEIESLHLNINWMFYNVPSTRKAYNLEIPPHQISIWCLIVYRGEGCLIASVFPIDQYWQSVFVLQIAVKSKLNGLCLSTHYHWERFRGWKSCIWYIYTFTELLEDNLPALSCLFVDLGNKKHLFCLEFCLLVWNRHLTSYKYFSSYKSYKIWDQFNVKGIKKIGNIFKDTF